MFSNHFSYFVELGELVVGLHSCELCWMHSCCIKMIVGLLALSLATVITPRTFREVSSLCNYTSTLQGSVTGLSCTLYNKLDRKHRQDGNLTRNFNKTLCGYSSILLPAYSSRWCRLSI